MKPIRPSRPYHPWVPHYSSPEPPHPYPEEKPARRPKLRKGIIEFLLACIVGAFAINHARVGTSWPETLRAMEVPRGSEEAYTRLAVLILLIVCAAVVWVIIRATAKD